MAQYYRPNTQATDRALRLYQYICQKSWWDGIRSIFKRRACRLLDLDQFYATCTIVADRNLGVQAVPINQIKGSINPGRSYDFDADFRPLKAHNKERWLGLAAAYQRGVALPPVILTQIGAIYFVQDGHHRISVARAAGQVEIKAVVTRWQVAGPLPWEDSLRRRIQASVKFVAGAKI